MPVEGISTNSFYQIESTGSSWYNALLANLTKRFQNGSEIQVAYTWSSSLSDTVEPSVGANGGTRTGNQNDPRADYGPDYFNRPTSGTMKAVVVMNGENIHIKTLDSDYEVPSSIDASWISDVCESTLIQSTLISLFELVSK